MTNNDNVAGLCERLRGMGWKRLGEPLSSEVEVEITNAADTLERQAAEIERLRRALEKIRDFDTAYLETGPSWSGYIETMECMDAEAVRALACAALIS